MILRSTAASPFARKVRIAIAVLGLADKIDVRETDLNDPADSIRVQNPLGKVPALALDDGTVYYDSRVIVDYLDHLAGGGKIIPREAPSRFDALCRQALCDGIAEASLLVVYESRYRPVDKHVASWVERQNEKVMRGLAALETAPPKKIAAVPDAGDIALACALGYRDLRFNGTWRKDHPKLVAWLDAFAAQVPSFNATKVAA